MNLKRIGKHILLASLFFGLSLIVLFLFLFAARSGAIAGTDNFVNELILFFGKKKGILFIIRLIIYSIAILIVSPKIAKQTDYEIKSIRYFVIGLCLIYEIVFVRAVGVF